MSRSYEKWTPEREARLRDLRATGRTIRECAEILGTSFERIRDKLYKYGENKGANRLNNMLHPEVEPIDSDADAEAERRRRKYERCDEKWKSLVGNARYA